MARHAGRRLAAIVAAASVWALLPASAAAGTHWRCELTPEPVRLACRADTPRVDAAAVESVTATVHGTRFPLDPTRRWFVDLWTPPSDAEWVHLLARATICYRSPDCTVELVDAAVLAAR